MVNSRQKGATCEKVVQDLLTEHTNLPFARTPGSGSGLIKGDLYIPNAKNKFCIEIKHYAESHFNDKIFTSKTNKVVQWWTKLQSQAKAANQKPLLIFKYNRSKFFVCTDVEPQGLKTFVDIRWLNCYTILLDDWLKKEKIEWLNS